jgi:signal transduction histidine kinase
MPASVQPTSAKRFTASTNSLGERVAFIDAFGNIVAVNQNWTALARRTGASVHSTGPGVNYLEVCRRAAATSADARQALNGINAVLRGKVSSFSMEYACQTLAGQSYFRMGVIPMAHKDIRAIITHTDITDLKLSNERSLHRLQQFARRLIHAQEEEREKISREIHDDLGSRIVLLVFAVRRIMKQHARSSCPSLPELNEVVDSLGDLSKALRNLSHCLHPPLLRYGGICAALKMLCDEFEKTQGIQIDVVVPKELPRLSDDVELCIFRVSQECLQNIVKHSNAGNVSVVLESTPREVRLKISDTGRGFEPSHVVHDGGLGLVSMEERVLCIRGRLEVTSAPGVGTEICVTIPLSPELSIKD